MKKEYIEPQMQAVNINNSQQLLSGSVTGVAGGVFDESISGGSGTGRAPGLDDFFNDADLDFMFAE